MKTLILPGAFTNKVFFEPLASMLDANLLSWPSPDKKESLGQYSERLAKSYIEPLGQPTRLVAFSFGGIVALEMTKHLKLSSLVTLNTVGGPEDINEDFRRSVRLGAKMPNMALRKLLNLSGVNYFKKSENLSLSQAKRLEEMLGAVDFNYLKWATLAVADWQPERPFDFSSPFLALHGEKNRLVRRPKNHEVEALPGQGFLGPLTHPSELSSRILQFWKKIPDS